MSISESEPTTMLGPGLAGTLMSPEEFDAIETCDENFVYELIHGVLVVNPPPSIGERSPNDVLGHWLFTYREQHPQGSSLDWTVSEHHVHTRRNRRRADRVIWAGLGRMPNVIRDQPTVVVEFVSSGKRNRHRDFVAKRKEYIEIEVQEYWIIDRFRRQMAVVRRQPEGTIELLLHETDVYTTPLLPGFELSLAKLLHIADLFEQTD